MFEVGDMIIYGNTGVCRVDDIRKMKPIGERREQLYYILQPLQQSYQISIPVASDGVFMRPIISRDEALCLIDSIPDRHVEAFHSHAIHELTQHYESALRSHSCGDLVDLAMSIRAKKKTFEKQHRRFGSIDERFMRRAENLLFGELSAALDIPVDDVPIYIENRLHAS